MPFREKSEFLKKIQYTSSGFSPTIKMSIAPETILANEAGIPYAAIAMSTDYDCWKDDEAPVTWEEILEVFAKNVNNVIDLITNAIKKIN